MKSWLQVVLLAGLFLLCASAAAEPASRRVAWIRIDGAIGPATAGYTERAVAEAGRMDAACLIIELDTPGGLLESTKQMVQAIYAAPVPVVVYVAPSGASAASAGCFITLAADVAAMAPHSNIGAAHPVELGGAPGGTKDGESGTVMAQKLENHTAAYIETIANKRQRNADWARRAVRESATLTAEAALEQHVIDLVAPDVPALLRALDGRTLRDGRVLATTGADVVRLPMLARERVFQLLWRPEVMFLLMLVAVYGIIGELSNPGAILPGVAGAIALILALYLGAILPINVAGLALMLLAIGLFIADVFATSHGVLTAGGVISFFLGSLMLFQHAGPAFRLSLAFIVPGTVVTALFFLLVVGAGWRAQRLPVRVGRETLVGQTGPALTPIDTGRGFALVAGESWSARSDVAIAAGAAVQVTAVRGIVLLVKPTN